eukprot:g3536.t1
MLLLFILLVSCFGQRHVLPVNGRETNPGVRERTRNLVVYDADNRYDELEAPSAMRDIGQSSVMFVSTSKLTQTSTAWTFNATALHFRKAQNVPDNIALGCVNPMPYTDQPLLGFCSGALVGSSNLISTAGHCVSDSNTRALNDVSSYKIVFNATKETLATGRLPLNTVFSVESVLASEWLTTSSGVEVDYGLLKLSSSVDPSIATPANVTVTSRPSVTSTANADALLIGHPVGLPRKYNLANVARVNDPEGTSSFTFDFNVPFDAFGGNSGSGVFSLSTGEMIGILIQGRPDFYVGTTSNGLSTCYDFNFCNATGIASPGNMYNCNDNSNNGQTLYNAGEKQCGASQLLRKCSDASSSSDLGVACTTLGYNGTFSASSSNERIAIGVGIGVAVVVCCVCIMLMACMSARSKN